MKYICRLLSQTNLEKNLFSVVKFVLTYSNLDNFVKAIRFYIWCWYFGTGIQTQLNHCHISHLSTVISLQKIKHIKFFVNTTARNYVKTGSWYALVKPIKISTVSISILQHKQQNIRLARSLNHCYCKYIHVEW